MAPPCPSDRRGLTNPAPLPKPPRMIRILALLALMIAPLAAQTPPAPAPAPAAQPAQADVQRALETLRDETRRAELIRLLEAMAAAQATPGATPPAADAPPAEAPLIEQAGEHIGRALGEVVEGIQSAADLPGIWTWLRDAATNEAYRDRMLDLGWKLLLVFGVGIAAQRLVYWGLGRWRDQLDARAPPEGVRRAFLRRLPFILARLGLDLLPVLAFWLVATATIPNLPGWPSQRVIIWTVANAYIVAHGFMVVVRLLFSPASNHLRLLPVADETAGYITVWMRRIALVSVTAYALSEFALLLAMPLSVQNGVLRLGLLIVSIFVIIIVLQNKLGVAQWLAARPLREGEVPDRWRAMLRGLRDRLADAWHILAILWVVAVWGVWALGLEGGSERLLRSSLSTVLVVVVAKLLDEGLRRILNRAFRISPELSRRLPGLETRANRYLPALKGLVGIIIMLAAGIILLEIWGLGAFAWFGQGRIGARVVSSGISIAFTLGLALLVWEVANTAIARHLARLSTDAATARSARVRTLLPMLRTALAIVVLVFVSLNVLTEIGVNVAPLLAGAGVIGLAVGFGSQTLVRDVITGIFLLLEDSVAVGDVVTLGGLSGTVEQLSIRSIRLRALNGDVHIVPFSAVTTVTNQTRDYGYAVLDLVVDYDADTDAVQAALAEVGAELRADETWQRSVLAAIEVMGVERLSDAGVMVRARIKTEPARRWAVARELNRRVKQRLGTLGITISPPSKVVQVAPA